MVKCLCFQVRPQRSTPYCSDLLNDGGCVALLVVGFLLVTPLLVLALAAYCRLARHLQLGLCFIPYSRAVYKNLPATQHRGLAGGCCGRQSGKRERKGKVWVQKEFRRKFKYPKMLCMCSKYNEHYWPHTISTNLLRHCQKYFVRFSYFMYSVVYFLFSLNMLH